MAGDDPWISDETIARYLSESINDHEGMVLAMHLVWLRRVAEALVRNHLHAVRSFAEALLDREVLRDAETQAI